MKDKSSHVKNGRLTIFFCGGGGDTFAGEGQYPITCPECFCNKQTDADSIVWRHNTAWKVSKYGFFSGPYFPVF